MIFPDTKRKESFKILKWAVGLTIVFVVASCWMFWMSAKREHYLFDRKRNFLDQSHQPGTMIAELIIRYHEKHGQLPQQFVPTVSYFIENGIAIPNDQTNTHNQAFGNYLYNLDTNDSFKTDEPWFLSRTG